MNEIKGRKLKPLELLMVTATIYKRYYKYILVACIFVFLPMAIVMLFVPAPDTAELSNLASLSNIEAMQKLMLYSWMALGVYFLFAPLFTSAVNWIVLRAAEDQAVDFAGMMDSSLLRWGKLIATSALYLAAIFLGAVFIFPALWLAIALYFYPIIISSSGLWGWKALLESYKAVKGRWFRTLGFLICMYFLTFITSTMVQELAYLMLPTHPITVVLTSVVLESLCSFYTVLIAVWFHNRKGHGNAG